MVLAKFLAQFYKQLLVSLKKDVNLFLHNFNNCKFKEAQMNVERGVIAIAGLFVFLSVLLGWLHSPYWYIFTGFVGLNLFQASFTKFCPMALFLKKMGLKNGTVFEK